MGKQVDDNKGTVYVIGGLLGAVVGLIAAHIIAQNYVAGSGKELNAGTGVKLGLAVMGLLRILAG